MKLLVRLEEVPDLMHNLLSEAVLLLHVLQLFGGDIEIQLLEVDLFHVLYGY